LSIDKESRSGFLAKTFDIAGKLGLKTLELAKIVKLNAEINSEKEKVRKSQLEIGKTYYENCFRDVHPLLKDCCDRIRSSLEIIDQKKCEIEDLKSKNDKKDDDDFLD